MKGKDPMTAAGEASNFQSCRQDALKQASSAPNDDKKAKRLLAICAEHFPGAAEAIACKKQALAAFGRDPKSLKKALKKCQQDRKVLAFDAKKPLPFVINKGNLFFAGMGLNMARKIDTSDHRIGNFNCQAVNDYLVGGQGEYLLFGNHPEVFSGFTKMRQRKIMKILGLNWDSDDKFQISPQFGQIYDIKDKSKAAAYLPVSFCYFERKIGSLFRSIKVYYLVNKDKKMMTPYFGIAFYRSNTKTKMKGLAQKAEQILGSGYKVQVQKPKYAYIAKAAFERFDAEGDPYNICTEQKKHEFVALLRWHSESHSPDYLVVANIANLCQFGDRLSQQLAKSKL